MPERSSTGHEHVCDSARAIATGLYLELRDQGFAAISAVETLGKTAGVLRDTHEYRSLSERARAYQDGVLASANAVAHAFELDIVRILEAAR